MAYSPANPGKYIPDATEQLPICGISSVGGIGQGLDKLKATLQGAAQQSSDAYVTSAYNILEEIAKRAIERPHNLPEVEIQILAAFVLGFNSK